MQYLVYFICSVTFLSQAPSIVLRLGSGFDSDLINT